jgi:hypothetical protein
LNFAESGGLRRKADLFAFLQLYRSTRYFQWSAHGNTGAAASAGEDGDPDLVFGEVSETGAGG